MTRKPAVARKLWDAVHYLHDSCFTWTR